MKRLLKITALFALLTVILLSILLTWLVRSEQGSRWLVQQGIDLAPLTIETSGITGTLAEGLSVNTLYIEFPVAELRATNIVLSWSPASLLSGVVDINNVHIAELSVHVVEPKIKDDPADNTRQNSIDRPIVDTGNDELFWLNFPIQISIESAQIDKLRIEEAELNELSFTGSIGHDQLRIDTADGQAYGIKLQLSGELLGPDPGRLEATGSWEIPAENLGGSGSFSGDIEKLNFTHVIKLPENTATAVNFNGTIFNLFHRPTLSGLANWPSLRLPGETALYSNTGNFTVTSDFISTNLEGSSTVLIEGWPEAPIQLSALVDPQGISIDSYTMEALDGQVSGSGKIDYSDGLQGQLTINGTQINTALLKRELPGQLGFESSLLIESADAFVIDVNKADAKIADKKINGQGRAHWRSAKLTAFDGNIIAGTNRLDADVKLGKQLAGSINTKAPELAQLWPGLKGALEASIIFSGSTEQPQVQLTAEASSVSFESLSLDTFNLSGKLNSNNSLAGNISSTGLVANEQKLGKLEFSLAGALTDHRSTLKLNGGVVDVELQTNGGWQNGKLTQTFEYGRLQPEGLASWQLEQNLDLQLSTESGKTSAHCWKQSEASICISDSNWGPDSLQSSVVIDGFALNTLQPLLTDGYSIDGMVDAELKLVRDTAGLQAELHWQQSHTVLGYADDINEFHTALDTVQLDLQSNDKQTDLTVELSGEQGLRMTAIAKVSGPLAAESPLEASANGRFPSIRLLRPLLQRVVQPGELQGELTVGLNAVGTLGDPVFTGGANLNNASLGILDLGITLSEINITAQSKGSDKLKLTGSLRSGDGNGKIFGEIHTEEKTGLNAEIHIQGKNLASVRTPNLSVDSSPDLTLRISKGVFDISGTITIPNATAQIRQLPKNAVPRSDDVIVHAPDRIAERQSETIVTGDVEVILGNQVRFNGFGLDSRLDGRLKLTQARGGYLRSGGTVRVRDGFLTGYGRELRVDRGELTFAGPLDDPLINIQVSRESIYEGRQYTIGLRLTGSAQHVNTEPFSRPSMSDRDIQSFLLLDQPASAGGDASGAAMALGLQQLVPLESGSFGLDEVSFETNDANEAAMVAGKRINDKLYVRYVFGSSGQPGAFRIRYRLGRGFSLESSTGNQQSLDLIYSIER